MKKILMMLALMPLMSLADTEVVNGIEWTYTIQDGEAVIEYRSYYTYDAAIPSTTTGAITVPATLGGCPVTRIGVRAFDSCKELTSITLPSSVQRIDLHAFRSCTGLTAIIIPDSVTEISSNAFYGCSNLREMTLPLIGSIRELFGWNVPASLQSVRVTKASALESGAFQECENLRSITLPVGVSTIGSSAFEGCRALQEIVIPAGVTNIANSAFRYCEALKQIAIPAGVSRIEGGAFADCKSLERVTLPTGLREIGFSAFAGCSKLASINIPTTVSEIGLGAFNGCRSLGSGVVIVDNCLLTVVNGCSTDVRIPDTVRLIVDAAFSDCQDLRSVTLPSGLKEIPDGLFEDCRRLTTVNLPRAVQNIGASVFYGCRALSSVALPNGLETIGDNAFGSCNALESVTIPASVRCIGAAAFWDCAGLTSLTISDGVQGIGQEAFYGTGLKDVFIPASVAEIGRQAFNGSKVETFRVDARNPNYKSVDGYLLSKDGRRLICGKACEEVRIPDGVETICDYAFCDCQKLKSVSIPASVQKISSLAFESCRQIVNVDIPDIAKWCDYSFGGVPHLRLKGEEVVDLVIPEGVTSIASRAFAGCTGLRSVSVPESLQNVGYSAFEGCTNLAEVAIVDLSSWCKVRFDNDESNPLAYGHVLKLNGEIVDKLEIPDGLSQIGPHVFAGCTSITSVRLPKSLIGIGYSAFRNCKSISSVYATSVEKWLKIRFDDLGANPCGNGAQLYFDQDSSWMIRIPEGSTDIGSYSFVGCESVQRIVLPESITYVSSSAFDGCTSLEAFEVADTNPEYRTIDGVLYSYDLRSLIACPQGKSGSAMLPSTMTYMSRGMFEACSRLTALDVEDGHPTYYSLNGCLYSRSDDALVAVPGGLKQLVLSANLSRIDAPLSLCKGLQSVRLTVGTTRIPERAFENCQNLEEASIPYGVIRIGASAFAGCSHLKTIVIPNSVQAIGSYAFQGCDNLCEMTLPFAGTTPTSQFYDLFGYSSVPASLQTVRITNVTALPNSVFSGCKGIRTISLPIGLSSIGDSAFRGCCALQEIGIPAGVSHIGVSAFEDCESLRQIVIPAGVTRLDYSTFSGCKALNRVTLPAGLIEIGHSAFSACRSLFTINIPSTVAEIGYLAFSGCGSLGSGVVIVDHCLLTVGGECPQDVVIPDSVRLIAEGAFYDCESVRTVALPKGLQEIPNGLFEDCVNLKKVGIPAGVKRIGWDAFSGCSSLESIALPEGLQSIDDDAFRGCVAIRSFHIPASLVEIGDCESGPAEFLPCSGYREYNEKVDGPYRPSQLTQLTVAAGNPRYAAFNNLLYTKDGKTLIRCPEGLENVKFKTGIQRICSDAFDNCARLRELVIPASVKEIGDLWWDDEENCWDWDDEDEDDIFNGCIALRKLSLPAGLTWINLSHDMSSLTELTVDSANKSYLSYSNALYQRDGARLVYCARGVSSVTLWNKTERIGSYAFEGCEKIKALVIPATVKWMYRSPFYGCTNLRMVEYKGNAPSVDDGLYVLRYESGGGCTPEPYRPRQYLNVTSYATPGTKGWPTTGVWQGRPLVLVSPAQRNQILNATYDGFALAESNPVAQVQMKTTSTGAVSATVTDIAGKKWNYSKGMAWADGSVEGLVCTTKGCPVPKFDVVLGKNGLSGDWGGYEIVGARRVKPGAYAKNWTVSFANGDWLQLKVDAAGVAKVVGWAAGKAYSASTQLIVGDGFAYVPVMAGKNATLVRIENPATGGENPVGVISSTSGEAAQGGVTAKPKFNSWSASDNAMVGVAFKAVPRMDGLGWPMTFKASGLPSGCKINEKTGVVSGIPTKAGTFVAKITATSGSNTKWTSSCSVTNIIVALPEWARGQFSGTIEPVTDNPVAVTVTVGSTGKISGKFKTGVTNWTFAASSYAAKSVTRGMTNLVCAVTAKGTYAVKSGKTTVTKTATAPLGYSLAARPEVSSLASATHDGFFGDAELTLTRVAAVKLAVGEIKGGTVKTSTSLGQAAPGGTVKLTVTPKTGYAFLGWFAPGAETPVSQATLYSRKMAGEDVFLTARFAKESSLAAPVLDWNSATNFPVGVSYAATPKVSGEAAVKIVSMSGLPAGLAFKSGKVSGAPTKVQSCTVSVKVALATNAKKTWTLKQRLVVESLPAWAVGSFDGGCDSPANQAKLTVSSVGKVSGKICFANAVWTLSGTKIAQLDLEKRTARLSLTATKGTTKKTVTVALGEDELGGWAAGETTGFVFEARQNLWKNDASWAEVAMALAGESLGTFADDLEAVFGANGTVTAKLKVGKNVFSCSAVLCPTELGDGKVHGLVYLYFAPNTTKKFKGAVRVVYADIE